MMKLSAAQYQNSFWELISSLFPGNRNWGVYGRYKDNSAVWAFMVSSMHVQYFEPHICATQLLYITAIGCHGALDRKVFPFFAANSALTLKLTKLKWTHCDQEGLVWCSWSFTMSPLHVLITFSSILSSADGEFHKYWWNGGENLCVWGCENGKKLHGDVLFWPSTISVCKIHLEKLPRSL